MSHAPDDEPIAVGGLTVRFLIDAADSNGTASVFECYVPASERMPASHSHDGFEETIYGLEGVTRWTIDGQTIEIGPGEAVCIPRGQIHGFDNYGAIDALFLAIATPAVLRSAHSLTAGRGSAPVGHRGPIGPRRTRD